MMTTLILHTLRSANLLQRPCLPSMTVWGYPLALKTKLRRLFGWNIEGKAG